MTLMVNLTMNVPYTGTFFTLLPPSRGGRGRGGMAGKRRGRDKRRGRGGVGGVDKGGSREEKGVARE